MSYLKFLLLATLTSAAFAGPPTFPGEVSEWNGFQRHDFKVADRAAIVVIPQKAADGNPWIWRARFWGHEPQTEIALLKKGFHVAYCDVADLFGAPPAVAIWNTFHAEMTGRYGLAERPALEGLSRGGLIIYNWAKSNPAKVACIYADAPVCDIRSWPRDHSSAATWAKCKAVYGITDAEVETFTGNPIDGLEVLVEAGVPLLHVVGDADPVVPIGDNTNVLAARYRALGGSIQIISKPGVGHHPHSLVDPTPIVDFILEHTP
ncbi:MAG: prolyl oligopeptidase family serine peptidase [Opitutaceae bacterium]|jgi:pimeloyl-ACP methyl ester carboxylesterase|nr:prolyl oligopeptidase family serine peptidase [Opitutaceae bacterium]